MTSVDITPITTALVGIGATALSIFGSMALASLAKRFNLQVTAGQSAAYNDALNKALAFGVTQVQSSILKNGWDHVPTQNAAVASALDYVVAREPAALSGVGLGQNFNDPETRRTIQEALMARVPAAFTVAAASPATPPAPPPAPVAVVEAQAGGVPVSSVGGKL